MKCQYPCPGRSRVPDPRECENTRCELWRRWFLTSWNQLRQDTRQQMDRAQTVPLGVPLGGRHYAPPHMIREYRKKDPCQQCAVKPLCKEKCKVRTLWEQQGGTQ